MQARCNLIQKTLKLYLFLSIWGFPASANLIEKRQRKQ